MRLNRKGQTLVEYVLIISLVTVIAIAAVRILGGYLKDSITKLSCTMIGKEYVEADQIGKLIVKVMKIDYLISLSF